MRKNFRLNLLSFHSEHNKHSRQGDAPSGGLAKIYKAEKNNRKFLPLHHLEPTDSVNINFIHKGHINRDRDDRDEKQFYNLNGSLLTYLR